MKKLLENVFSMLTLKGMEYILNFISFPILLRALGVEQFGLLGFVQSIMQYGVILVDYGFNMTAPKEIARAKNNTEIANLFFSILISKIILGTIVTLCCIVIFYCGGILEHKISSSLFWSTYLVVIGNIIFPVWFFQGIQEMRYITIANIISRAIVVYLLLYYIVGPEDLVLASLLLSSTFIISGIIAFIIIGLKYYKILKCVTTISIINQFKEGFSIFLSTIAINVYTASTVVILGLLTNNMIVGYYTAAQKILDAIKGIMNTIMQAVFPYSSRLLIENLQKGKIFMKRLLFLYTGFFGICSILIFFCSSYIFVILGGRYMPESAYILEILGLIPFVVSISNVYGVQILINLNHQKLFSNIIICGAIINLLCIYPAIHWFSAIGAAWTYFITELLITFLTFYFVECHLKYKLVTSAHS